MSYAKQMLDTRPGETGFEAELLAEAIEAMNDCAQACTACADACLAEQHVTEMVACIRLNLDCADVCETTARVWSRQTAFDAEPARALLEACVRACRSCADECARHGGMGMKHCEVCAEACRRCADACERLLAKVAA